MDIDYVFLCGVMWCRFGQKDAGEELLRASNSDDQAIKELAWTMFTRDAEPAQHPPAAN